MFLKRFFLKWRETIRQNLFIETILPDKLESVNSLAQHIARYLFANNFAEKGKVLDIGCGSGYGLCYLSMKAEKAVGGDISEKVIRSGSRFYRRENLQFLIFDACHLPFKDRTFDLITCFEVIEHLSDAEKCLAECERVLKTDGIFICSTPNREVQSLGLKKPKNPFHVKEFNAEEFYEKLSRFVPKVSLYGQLVSNRKGTSRFGTLKAMVAFLIRNVPLLHIFTNMTIGKLRLQYRFVKLSNYDVGVLGQIVEVRYHPFPLNEKRLPVFTIIGIAERE